MAIVVLSGFWLVVAALPVLLSSTPALDVYGYLGTASGYAFTVAYAVAALIALLRARTADGARPLVMTASVLGVIAMVVALYNSFHPFPEGAYGTVAWISIAAACLLVVLYGVLRAARPVVLERVRETARVEAH